MAAPDLDGDGLPDFLVAGNPSTLAYSGRTLALLGTTSVRVESFNTAFVGDANGDGVPDVAYLGVGSSVTTLRIYEIFSDTPVFETVLPRAGVYGVNAPVGVVPDLNQDGVDDMWVRVESGAGANDVEIELRSTVDGSLIRSLSSPSGLTNFGHAVTVLDDLDGDGIGELAICERSPITTVPFSNRRVYIMSPVTGATLRVIHSPTGTNRFGDRVVEVGDLDGDLVNDLAITVREGGDAVAVYSAVTGQRLMRFEEPEAGGSVTATLFFGTRIIDVGDVDLDLVPDVVITSPRTRCSGVEGGAAFLFSGATGELILTAFDQGVSRPYAQGLALLGDINDDDVCEWAVMDPRSAVLGDMVAIDGYGYEEPVTALRWEQAGDGVTPIENGRDMEAPGLFAPHVRLVATGTGGHGAAAFDTNPSGANAQGSFPGFLVDRGNVIVMQDDPVQSTPGIYDSPAPGANGGTLIFELLQPAAPRSIDLVATGTSTQVQVILRDEFGLSRVYDVPPGYTSDLATNPRGAVRGLRLNTLDEQAGYAATATVDEDPLFDVTRLAYIEVWMNGPGALDRLILDDPAPASQPGLNVVAEIEPLNGSEVLSAIGVGDLDGDGRSEIAVANGGNIFISAPPSIQVHSGFTGGLIQEIPSVRASTLDATDRNGSAAVPGRILTGDPGWTGAAGSSIGLTYVYDPMTGQRQSRTEGPGPMTYFGEDIAFMGDVDGDGVDDFAATAPDVVPDPEVRIVSGASGQILRSMSFPAGDVPEMDIVRGEDLDGDGVDDVVVTAASEFSMQSGAVVRAYSTGTGALLFERLAGTDALTLTEQIERVGDRDGDGIDDLVCVDRTAPVTIVVVSGADGRTVEVSVTSVVPHPDAPVALCVPGDMTGDGVVDIAIGRRRLFEESEVILFSGDGLSELERAVFPGVLDRGWLSPVGDVTGDGLANLGVDTDDRLQVLRYDAFQDGLVCRGQVHSGGVGARLAVTGSRVIADDDFRLRLSSAPATSFALLLNASSAIPPFGPGSVPLVSDGGLCLSPATLVRHPTLYPVSAGLSEMDVPLSTLPTANVPGFARPAMAGETRVFQCWFRDPASLTGSNLSDAVAVTFQ